MVRIADDAISVRRAGRDDLGQVLDLYSLLDGPYASAGKTVREDEAWRTLAGDHRQYLMVAEDGGRVVGTATIIIIANIGHGGKPWAAVENVVVAEEYRGRSVGTRLMIAVGDIARRLGCYKLVLSSNATRAEAHEFYRRLGWRQRMPVSRWR